MLCLGPIGDFCIGDGEMYNYTRDASRCLAILSINTSRLFAKGSVIPNEHRLMLVNFHRECIGDAKKSPVGPSHYICGKYEDNLDQMLFQCPFLAVARNLVKGWLEIAGIDQDNFNRHTLIKMTEVDALQNNVISNYKDIILN